MDGYMIGMIVVYLTVILVVGMVQSAILCSVTVVDVLDEDDAGLDEALL
jgi:hypothetical protein